MHLQMHGAITGEGTEKLPWEITPLDTAIKKHLGVFRKVVLQLLDRNPANRPDMQQFCAVCQRVFSETKSQKLVCESTNVQVKFSILAPNVTFLCWNC